MLPPRGRLDPIHQLRSKIGPGIELISRGSAMAMTTCLTTSFLPRCLDSTVKGNHFTIVTADA